MSSEWIKIEPKVKPEAEFLEIAADFGDPMEIFREAISNAYDAKATQIKINIFVTNADGDSKLVIEFEDNGIGMSQDVLVNNFWDLGNSLSKQDKTKIGEKGHGTKIFLRSKEIKVITHHESGSYESVCTNPFQFLNSGKMHSPQFRKIDSTGTTGTYIRIEDYNNSERSRYLHDIVVDYINWFTKHGSFENQFGGNQNFVVLLKCLDDDDFSTIEFGHRFAPIKDNLNNLFSEYGSSAGDYFVKKYIFEGRLEKKPEIQYRAVIYIEGDQAKKAYNPLLRNRKTKGYYKVADRYGIWLGKDYIPIQRVNDWITGFGTGSNSYLLLHGFINCQDFKLTANRGSIANTNPDVLSEIKNVVQGMIRSIDEDLTTIDLYTVSKWQDEEKTLEIEKAEFSRRKLSIGEKKISKYRDLTLLEPKNESELFGLFTTIYALNPEKFVFEPLDYNTSRGIDIIARNKSDNKISDCEFWYVELKFNLEKSFNHSFKYTRWIICWDFSSDVKHDSIITTTIEGEERTLKWVKDENNKKLYFLEKPTDPIKICIIRLREYLEEELNIKFIDQ